MRNIFPRLSAMGLIILIVTVILFSPFLLRWVVYWSIKHSIYSIEEVPTRQIAIVFGAGLNRSGRPTTVLRDRVEVASQLYNKGKVTKLLFSGDNRWDDYNEPLAMQTFAISLGVPKEAIVLDYAGRRTYDTCYRAKFIFEVENAILVTQSFHLSRALYTCQQLGIQAVGVASDIHPYRKLSKLYWNFRETMATLNAIADLRIIHPKPVLGNPEPIFPKEIQ